MLVLYGRNQTPLPFFEENTMRHIDYVQVSLIANVIAIFVAAVTAIIVAWNNAGSKNMPLAAAALVGVTVGYLIQLPFELTRSTTRETIGADFVIDRSQPVLRQWVYSNKSSGWRIGVEVGASNWLTKNDPQAFDQLSQREKVTKDMVVFSLLSFLTHEEYDWQLERKSYGSLETTQVVSKPGECKVYTESDLKEKLRKANNVFADAPLQVLTGTLCLPPETQLEVSADLLTLKNRFCKIKFTAEHPANMILNVDPQTRAYVPFTGGEPRFEIRTMGLNVETTFFALRAQHRDSSRYHDWASRVVNGVRLWFAPGDPGGQPQKLASSP
jgi:hypothetical protein